MKISKKHLQDLIKEELLKLLIEDAASDAFDEMEDDADDMDSNDNDFQTVQKKGETWSKARQKNGTYTIDLLDKDGKVISTGSGKTLEKAKAAARKNRK
tara:strand:+ start:4106 stop:4402 length:297 start_codon:yes stop_codon:yes gene_type:complete